MHHVLHTAAHLGGITGMVLSKAAYCVPVGSLAYLALSTVTDPFHVADAAAKVIAGKIPWKHEKHAVQEAAGGSQAVGADAIEALARELRKA
mgnify:CR=1 FL=1